MAPGQRGGRPVGDGCGGHLVAVVLALPESLPAPLRQPARLRQAAGSLAGLARDGRFLQHVLAAALMFAATFAYISGSSFVLQQDYQLSAQQFSLIFAANGLGIVLLGAGQRTPRRPRCH